jgi:hypothetical protein
VFVAVTRREYFLVGSAPASLLATVTAPNTKLISPIRVWSEALSDVSYFHDRKAFFLKYYCYAIDMGV